MVFTGTDLPAVFALAEVDEKVRQALLIASVKVVGNLMGLVLLLTPLTRGFRGACLVAGYEFVFLLVSLLLLSIDYSLIIAAQLFACLYIAKVRREAHTGRVAQ